jgi:Ankyrin repeats (3 copies)/Ankyrin repeats (many copies)
VVTLDLFRLISFGMAQVNVLISPLMERVYAVWNHVHYAILAKPLPNVELPLNPVANPYPREYKKVPWPANLDRAALSDDEVIALGSDPLEKASPLHAAAYANNVKAIYRLIRDGADVNAVDYRGQSAAYWAAYFGNLEALMVLASYNAKLDQPDKRGKTPLRAAVKYGRESVVSLLITQKVSLNVKDGRNLTPLHLAAYHRHFKVFEKLAYHKADLEMVDGMGRNPRQLLREKTKEVYHKRWLPLRLVTSPTPPKLIDRFEGLP